MRTIHGLSLFIACVAIWLATGPSVARCEETLWQTDFEAAKAQALAQKKTLLVDFTGSDWCGWCIKLHKEVFDKDAFKEAAPKNFVLVELDFPHQKELPEALKLQNDKLAKQYGIDGFPTVLLLDPQGEVIAHTGYQEGGPEKYVESLAGLLKKHDAIVQLRGQLATVQGEAKAKLLDQLIGDESDLGVGEKEMLTQMKEVVALDPDNKAGFKTKYGFRLAAAEFADFLRDKKFDEALAANDKVLAMPGLTNEQKQDAYIDRCRCMEAKDDLAGCVATLKKADAAVPDGPNSEQIKFMLTQLEGMAKAQVKPLALKAELEKTTGPDRLAMLDKVLEAYAKVGNRVGFNPQWDDVEKWSHEVIQLDPDNKAGLKNKYQSMLFADEGQKAMMSSKLDDANKAFDQALAIKGITPEQIQHISFMKVQCCMAKRDVKGAIECATKAIEAAPDSKIAGTLKQILAQAKAADKQKED